MNKLFFKKVLFCFKGSLLIALVCLIIYSCSKSNDGEEVFLQSFHPIEVNNKSNLTIFSANQAIKNLTIKKISINNYTIDTENYSKNQVNFTFNQKFNLQLLRNIVQISKIENGNIFTLKKDVVKNELLFSINSTIIVL